MTKEYLKYAAVFLAVVAIGFAGLVVYRIPAAEERLKTAQAVAKIHSQKITLADVLGQRLPPKPDSALNNATLEGIDANQNGIRDDVELAIFKLHPDSARIRAAELQYAMELQDELILISNSDTWVALAKNEEGISCLVDVAFDKYTDTHDQINKSDDWRKEIDNLVFNSSLRISRKVEIAKYETAFATGVKGCDIDLKTLSN